MKTGDELQRANRRLLLAMVIFAIALCALCFAWMYGRMKRAEQTGTLSGQRSEILRPAGVVRLPPERFSLI
ncbi:MAG: hypothetical protein JO117_11770 [Verrucomicrobia bacterium]|nr:hypothetical protein [Verrucomicrobiota bacterium]MBV9657503.1 hypothetical protein [Verrucomicrobiota bacterium]